MPHDIVGKRILDVVPERIPGRPPIRSGRRFPGRDGKASGPRGGHVGELQGIDPGGRAEGAAIGHEKFHCAQDLNKAVDLVLALRTPGMAAIRSRYTHEHEVPVAQNPRTSTERQREPFAALRVDTLKVGRAWAIKGRVPSSGTIATPVLPEISSTAGTSGPPTRAYLRSSSPPRP